MNDRDLASRKGVGATSAQMLSRSVFLYGVDSVSHNVAQQLNQAFAFKHPVAPRILPMPSPAPLAL